MLALVTLCAVAMRLISAVLQGDTVLALPGVYDQVSYDMLAKQVLAGHGFTVAADWWPATRAGEPTAHWSYLYTLYLAGVYSVAGVHPLAARVIQACIAGVLYPLLGYRIAGRLFGPRTAVAAAVLMGLYGYLIYYAGALMTETFQILALLWMLDVSIGIAMNDRTAGSAASPAGNTGRSRRAWLWLGLAVGLAVLLRQLVLLVVPVVFAWLVWSLGRTGPATARGWNRESVMAAVRGCALSTFVVVALVAPWTIRNYQAFGRIVPLNTNAGFAFFWGNHPIYGTEFIPILPAPGYLALVPAELLSLNEANLDSALLSRGIGFVVDDPMRYVLLSASRTKEYFRFWPSDESGAMSNIARSLSFGVAFPFMLYGLGLALRRSASGTLLNRRQRDAIILLFAFGGVYTLIHLMSWALIRYRLPVDAILLIFAAYGLVDVAQRASNSLISRSSRNSPTAVLAARADTYELRAGPRAAD
jgi:4-amino-4-deoxy-L-arabinose transferase-like glycosyltransferase